MDADRIVYIDCGAGGGDVPAVVGYCNPVSYIGFDPSLAETKSSASDCNLHKTMFPFALWSEKGEFSFYETRNPNCSSFLRPNPKVLKRYSRCRDFFDVLSERSLTCQQLDECIRKSGIERVDFVELDVQGAALEVLKGSRSLLEQSVLGLRIEVEFVELYEHQPLFGEVDSFLKQYGFRLFGLDRYHLVSDEHLPGMVTQERAVWGQALYFRDTKAEGADEAAVVRQARLAFAYGYSAYAISLLDGAISEGGTTGRLAMLARWRDDLNNRVDFAKGARTWRGRMRSGLGEVLRKLADRVSPSCTVRHRDDKYFYKT